MSDLTLLILAIVFLSVFALIVGSYLDNGHLIPPPVRNLFKKKVTIKDFNHDPEVFARYLYLQERIELGRDSPMWSELSPEHQEFLICKAAILGK
ncbi:hypothetical protein Q5H92_14550 [Hymenobacter sp. M29]|uniref:Uncharacterized protein n=1 Tax=Hymenobacter mellowenesis TaxID=3063995 RepID=A0ABT9ACK5_9BACT|nr:hypothetical protein [Hymenobacter sp. M29]MDO7847587.1 hypothetical protein [Hymenobacter sp. M29]